MSFEGYMQYLCPQGHYWERDVYEERDSKECPRCNQKVAWQNIVDETNGTFYKNRRIDDYVILVPTKSSSTPTTFHIPKDDELYACLQCDSIYHCVEGVEVVCHRCGGRIGP